MNKINKNTVTSNLFWRFADKWGSQLVSLLISTILARLISPDSYGIVTIINATINIFSVFSDFGLSDSLIQKKDIDDLDYSTALITNLILCITIYFIVFGLSSFVEVFYNINGLATYLKVSAISIIISPIKNIQHAYVSKNMLFKSYFFASLIGTIGAGLIGIYLALSGYGAWSLVLSNLFDVITDTIICIILIKWRPKLGFSINRLKSLFGFGIGVLISNLINRIYNKLYQLTIGKVYDSSSLSYFDKGDNIPYKIVGNIDYSINSILFPVLSSIQDEKTQLKKISKKMLKMDTYILSPILIGLFSVADNFVNVIYTSKWSFAIPYLRIFCVMYLFMPMLTINNNIIKSAGMSNILVKQQIIKRVTNVIILLITVKKGTLWMAYGLLINQIKDCIIDSIPAKRQINYGLFEQLLDVFNSMKISIFMGVVVYFIGFIRINELYLLIVQVLSGVVVYVLISYLLKDECFDYAINMLKKAKK